MKWHPLSAGGPPPGQYLTFGRHGIEVGSFYGHGMWNAPCGCPLSPTHWAPLPPVPETP